MIEPTPRANRRGPVAVAMSLALVAALLASCGPTVASPSAPASASPTQAPASAAASPPASQGASPSQTAAATPSESAAIALCGTADIAATAGELGGAAGSRGADVVVRTSGTASCQLPAFPAVAVVDSTGTVLLQSRLPLTSDGPTISSSGSFTFSFQISNWCDTSTNLPLHVALAVASGLVDIGGLSMAADDLPPCNGPGQPASVSANEWVSQ